MACRVTTTTLIAHGTHYVTYVRKSTFFAHRAVLSIRRPELVFGTMRGERDWSSVA